MIQVIELLYNKEIKIFILYRRVHYCDNIKIEYDDYVVYDINKILIKFNKNNNYFIKWFVLYGLENNF